MLRHSKKTEVDRHRANGMHTINNHAIPLRPWGPHFITDVIVTFGYRHSQCCVFKLQKAFCGERASMKDYCANSAKTRVTEAKMKQR